MKELISEKGVIGPLEKIKDVIFYLGIAMIVKEGNNVPN